MRLVAEPIIPVALWSALAVAAIVALGWYFLTWRPVVSRTSKLVIGVLMSVGIALPLIVLLNLTWIEPVPPPAGKPVVHVLVDDSASMGTRESNGRSRMQAAQQIASDVQTQLGEEYDIQLHLFDQQLRSTSLEQINAARTDSQQTDIAAALDGVLTQDVPQGQAVLLVSDGIHNASNVAAVLKSAKLAQSLNVPIYPITLGGQVGLRNVAVSMRSPQELSFVGQTIPILAFVQTRGLNGQSISLSISHEGEVLATETVVTDNSGLAEVNFEIKQDQPGLYRYEVAAQVVADEATAEDNRATLLLSVVDRPVKVLLVEGKPYWDTKFLVRNLTSDPSIELTSIVRMAESRYLKRVVHKEISLSASPADAATSQSVSDSVVENATIVRDVDDVLTAASLAEFQVLILGRDAEIFLNDRTLDLIQNWIAQDGGSLVCARGAPSAQIDQRLSQILPVKWNPVRETRFRMQLTPQGKDLRWLSSVDSTSDDALSAMPSLAFGTRPVEREGLTSVLAAASGTELSEPLPVVSFQPYGMGRTVVVEGAGMWRWALLAPQYAEREEVYGTLWRSLMRWLISRAGLLPGQNIALQPDKVSFSSTEQATATLLTRIDRVAEPPKIILQSASEAAREFVAKPVGQDPGVFRVDFGVLAAGAYTVSAKNENGDVVAHTAFDSRDPWTERLDLDARPDLMQRIALESGGVVLDSASPSEFLANFQKHLEQSRPIQIRRVTMWDRWWILVGVLAVWAGSWVRRRRSGLI